MSHISPDYPTKKAFKAAFKAGVKIHIFEPVFPLPSSGRGCVEAPAHYHKWYASVEYKDGIITKITG